ncbi:AraC family transcriptional regulator [Jidongwangia harbinensis]|uniref:AraC family transcriptional regulator n=1 Tax=Jidongwangia harbinensis TaxID=2878561 RepID=UPI001CDA4975|nr:AraC family transcriptional regulator [Jidongwangia harbinensis]MCA2212123.1 AraC family transcriptional regulator [Jidongwangia harbinensis]
MIGQAVASLRAGRGTVRRFRRSGAWGIGYAGLTGSGFHLILRGTAWLISADAPPVALRPGDVVLITSGADHGLSAAPARLRDLPPVALGLDPPEPGPADVEFLCGAYRLERGPAHPALAALPDPIVVPADGDQPERLRALADLFDADGLRSGPGAGVTWPALLDLMLVHALRRWLARRPEHGRLMMTDPAVAVALRAIHDSPQTRWTVTQLGHRAGLSRAAFTRRFTASVGEPPMRYLTGWRLNCAARLLRDTGEPLAAIARQVGYATEYAFAAAFRREFGTAPGRFRERQVSGAQ